MFPHVGAPVTFLCWFLLFMLASSFTRWLQPLCVCRVWCWCSHQCKWRPEACSAHIHPPLLRQFTAVMGRRLFSRCLTSPSFCTTTSLGHRTCHTHESCHHNSSRSSLRLSCLHQGRGSVIPAAPCLRPVVDVAASYTLAHCGRDSDCGYDGVCGSDGRCRCHFSRAGTLCDVPVNVSGACAPITGVSIACHSGLCSLYFQNWLAHCCICLGS